MTSFALICPSCDLLQADPEGVVCEECGARLLPAHVEAIGSREPERPPRFVVGKVSGYAISSSGLNGDKKERTIWYVYDSAYGYKILQVFHSSSAESRARELAEELEDGDGQTLGQRRQALRAEIDRRRREQLGSLIDCGDPSESRYRSGGCRCEGCRTAAREARKARADGTGISTHNYAGYSRGCRCELCREGHRVYQREQRRLRAK